jgi:hypothetical protein
LVRLEDLIISMEENEFMKNELNLAYIEIKNFAKIYETMFLLNSYTEELKLFIAREYIIPQQRFEKTFFIQNKYDTKEKLQEDLTVLINNYKIIKQGLRDYPEWQAKFKLDVEKQFAFINILKNFPDVYEVQDQQRLFK